MVGVADTDEAKQWMNHKVGWESWVEDVDGINRI